MNIFSMQNNLAPTRLLIPMHVKHTKTYHTITAYATGFFNIKPRVRNM